GRLHSRGLHHRPRRPSDQPVSPQLPRRLQRTSRTSCSSNTAFQIFRLPSSYVRRKKRTPPRGGVLCSTDLLLKGRLNLKSPRLKQRLRDVLGVFIPPRPFAQTGRPDVLVRRELKLLHDLFKRCYRWDNRADRL